ncbi:cadherin EGF LAG seven-pass G-type receptor 2-like [Patiria miniata]|uniref:Uncharacterized protein n=1 Tax=Patiria miniata TaxID=46514 RepID=A0A914B2Y7_PATMI|nr:cadherin EGF LAG seven-pass G-type receptor 2-like [Patiria miniata]
MSKLSHLTQSSAGLTSPELDAATEMLTRLANRALPGSINDTQADIYLEDFLAIVNNILNPVHTDEWISLQQTSAGTTSVMKSVETFTSSIASHWNRSTLNPFTDVLINKSNILSSMEFIPRDYFSGQSDLVVPQRSGPRWQSLAEKWQSVDDEVAIPEDLITNTPSSMGAMVSFTLYDTLPGMVPITATDRFAKVEGKSLWLNSRILSLGVEPAFEETLDEPILITLTHQTRVIDSKTEKAVCAFWKFDVPHTINGAWDSEGCEVQSTSQTQTVCRCYHLTSFAIIVEPQPLVKLSEDTIILRWLVRCLVGLSVFLLLILIITYIMSKRVHTLRHSIHLNQCLACLIASVAFGLSEFTSDSEVLCLASGAAMHYFYLVVFLWSTMETCQLYRDTTVGGMVTSDAVKGFAVCRNGMGYYMIGGWGIPAVVVGSVLAVSLQAYKPQAYDLCWLVEEDGMPWAYSTPCCAALCVNIFILIMVRRGTDSTVRKLDRTTGFRSSVRATIILNCLYAMTWVVGWKAIYGGPLWTSYLFVILNSLQGFFVFVLQGVCNVER